MCAKRSGRAVLKAMGADWIRDPSPPDEDQWVKDAVAEHERRKAEEKAAWKARRAYQAARYYCELCGLVELREEAADGWDEHYPVPLSYETATLCPGCVEVFKAVEARRPADT